MIKTLRTQTGLSQAQFAARFKIPLRTVQHWEQGRQKPPEYVPHLIRRVIDLEKIAKERGIEINMENTEKKSLVLPRGLKLFVADIEIEDDGVQVFWYILAKTYDSAFAKFTKEANDAYDRYLYYFYEASKDDIEDFLEHNENIKAGVYEKW